MFRRRWRQARRLILKAAGPLSPFGRGVLVVGVVAWVVGARFGWREFLVIAGACVVAVAIAAAFTVGRVDLRVDIELVPPRLRAGQTASVGVVVTNVATRRMLPVRLELPIGNAVAPINVPFLGAGGTSEDTVVIPDDVKELTLAVLAHRLLLTPEAQFGGVTAEQVIGEVLSIVPPPTERSA